ncbi:transporter [Ancylomarina salipaludis]|uniref:Transporter n=1 Tax=Ancylomarina salipaludis TaxID=2501299 RepID=A0A4Q1JK44_9BACT|nr:OmpP1/FadL family transporter [Ancylomarina salipaludis]RXQ92925.1 transporter [Ancylomarina salipaludis]
MLRKIYLAIALIAVTYSVKAEGYAVNVQGAKQTGMGHVGVAINWDASSMQFNPGALATLNAKYSLSMGGSLVWSNTEYTNLSSSALNTETDNPVSTPFYLYGSAKLTDKLAVGLAVYTPFGSSNVWGDNWAGKYLIQDISMKSIYIQPTVSYQLNEWLSVGAGLNIVYGEFELNKAFPIMNPADGSYITDGSAQLSGNTIKYGYNLGIFLQPTEKLNIGISYRSKVDIELDDSEGEGKFSFPSTVPPALVAGYNAMGVKDGSFTATLPLPASLNVGLAYQIDEKWLVSADVNFVEWSVYKKLEFVSKDAAALNSLNKREWDNSMTYRIGAQYSANEKLDLRAGFYYDETPTNDKYYAPETPGANKIGITGGFSYLLNEKFSIDAAFIYSKGEKREAYDTNTKSQNFGGEYQNTAFIPSIGITYNF